MDPLHGRQRFFPHDGVSSVKRRKAQLACNYCRDRKTRCDGRQPACSPCQKRGCPQECVYGESTLRTQRQVAKLEQKIKELERTNAQLSENVRDCVSSPGAASGMPAIPTTVTRTGVPLESGANLPRPVSHDAEGSGDPIDGLATVSLLPPTERAAVSYGGSLPNVLDFALWPSMVRGSSTLFLILRHSLHSGRGINILWALRLGAKKARVSHLADYIVNQSNGNLISKIVIIYKPGTVSSMSLCLWHSR